MIATHKHPARRNPLRSGSKNVHERWSSRGIFVLAAGGRADKQALGDHSPAGYAQRARFYSISDEGRLNYARNVASYIIFLADSTGVALPERCAAARTLLSRYTTMPAFLGDIGR